MSVRRSRRELFTSWIGALHEAADRARPVHRGPDPATALRPPGALAPDALFLEKCTGCGDCLPACPPGSILRLETADGGMIPAIHPAVRPCYLCPALPCVASCTAAALVDPGAPEQARLGLARVDPRRCVTFRGETCDRCIAICPVPEAIRAIAGRPLVASSACTGCGLCEQCCPERPRAIAVIAERHLVPGLRVPADEYRRG